MRVRFHDARRVPALLSEMRCHYAYARSRGFATNNECPLYLRGVEFRAAHDDERAIDIVAKNNKTSAEIRKRIRGGGLAGR